MLVTLLTMLVAMNASAQTQNYYSEGFENWSNGNASRNGWTIDQSSYVQRGNGHAHTGTYALQIGSDTGSSPSNIVTPFLGKDGSIPSNAVMTLWFCMDNVNATITLSAEGGATISSITPSNTNKVTCSLDLDNGTAVVSATEKKYYMLTINLTGCNKNTKLRIKTTHRTYIDDLLVTGEADQRTPVTLEYSADKYTTPTESGVITGAPTLTVTPPEAAQYVVFSSSDENVAKFENGKLIAVAPGTTTITASISGNETYRDAEDSYTLKVGLASSNLKFNPESATVTYDKKDNFTAPTLSWANGYDKNLITFTSSNENVATVVNMDDDGKVNISIHAVGVTTITASGAATPYLKESDASFILTVNDIQGSAVGGGTGGKVFEETFDKINGTGGNDGAWSGGIASTGLILSGNDKNVDEDGWEFTYGYGGYMCARIGASKNHGSATTREIAVTVGQNYNLTFKAASWAGENKNKLDVSITGGSITGIPDEYLTEGEWKEYSATITPTSKAITITFTVPGKKRFFLDEINVAAPSTGETVNVTIPASGWGTFCYKYPLDFTAASTPEGLKAYAVSSTTSSKATLTQITEKIIGGTGIIINGTPGATYTINVADQGTPYSGNLLTGTLSPTYVEEGQYFLKSGQFVYSSAGILPEKKAYLKKENAPEAAANFGFVIEDATGISEVRNNITLDDDKWYDLSGRAVSPTSKGIYIHNGKKYVIK